MRIKMSDKQLVQILDIVQNRVQELRIVPDIRANTDKKKTGISPCLFLRPAQVPCIAYIS